jgi:hypothetical protein
VCSSSYASTEVIRSGMCIQLLLCFSLQHGRINSKSGYRGHMGWVPTRLSILPFKSQSPTFGQVHQKSVIMLGAFWILLLYPFVPKGHHFSYATPLMIHSQSEQSTGIEEAEPGGGVFPSRQSIRAAACEISEGINR